MVVQEWPPPPPPPGHHHRFRRCSGLAPAIGGAASPEAQSPATGNPVALPVPSRTGETAAMTGKAPVPEALRRLVEEAVLSPEQAAEVERALRDAAPARPPRIPWAEVAGYLGGGLVLVGAVLLVATSWAGWTEPARTAVAGTATLLLLTAGVVAAHGFPGLGSALSLFGAQQPLGESGTGFRLRRDRHRNPTGKENS